LVFRITKCARHLEKEKRGRKKGKRIPPVYFLLPPQQERTEREERECFVSINLAKLPAGGERGRGEKRPHFLRRRRGG